MFETERMEMIDKTCIPANRETMVLLSSVPINRQKDHDEVNLRDDVFREKKKCGVTVNVGIIEQTRMFTVKKKRGCMR